MEPGFVSATSPQWLEVSGGVPAAANNKHRGGKREDDGKNVSAALIKASVQLDHMGGNSGQSTNLGVFVSGLKVTR